MENEEEDSVLAILCRRFEGVVLDAKHFRAHWWLPKLRRLRDEAVLLGDTDAGALVDKRQENMHVSSSGCCARFAEPVHVHWKRKRPESVSAGPWRLATKRRC